MHAAVSGLGVLAVVALGLSAGAMLTEGVVFVSYWRSLAPQDFLAWFRENDARLVAFFGPLQVTSAVLVAAAAGLSARTGPGPQRAWLAAATLLTVAALLFYPLYFRALNAKFATAALSLDEVPAALTAWSRWHWVRTAVGTSAFVAGLMALRGKTG